MPTQKKTVVGYALGGGGARGLSHIGVLKALERHGVFPDVITGTSMGALIGALYASGFRARDLEEILLSFDRRKLARLFDFTIPTRGLIQGKRVMSFLESILGNMTFADTQLPFACVATDIMNGQEVVFTEGRVADAVRASMSIPGFLTPVCREARYLVDGGVINAVPVSLCRRLGSTYVIGVNVIPDPSKVPQVSTTPPFPTRSILHMSLSKDCRPRPPGLLQILTQTLLIAEHHIAVENIKDADLVITPDVKDLGFWQFQRSIEAIALGEAAAEHTLGQTELARLTGRSTPPEGIVQRLQTVMSRIASVREAVGNVMNPKE